MLVRKVPCGNENMRYVIGLDTATITGVCILGEDGSINAFEQKFKDLQGIARVDAFLRFIDTLCDGYNDIGHIAGVCIEGYGYANAHTLATLVEVGTGVRLGLHVNNITPIVVAPNTLKKFATGKGNAKKDQIMLAVYKRWGYDSKTNNIADAFVLAKIAERLFFDQPDEIPAYQQEVLKLLYEEQCT